MTTRSRTWWNALCLLLFPVLLFVLLWLIGVRSNMKQRSVVSDTTRVVVVDTVTVRAPVAVDSVVLRYETVRLPLSGRFAPPTVEKVDLDSVLSKGSIPSSDSVTVEIPITQQEYGDSTWRAWVSGYGVRLDSIRVYPRREVVTVTQTMTRRVSKRWGIGIQTGYGWQHGAGCHPYIGLGIQYNLLSF